MQAQDRHASQLAQCPACKRLEVIPAPTATLVWKAPEQKDGPASSLARAGMQFGVTLAPPPSDPTVAGPQHRSLADALVKGEAGGQRYLLEGELARGGMGAVMRAVDCDIRREVAIKYLLDQHDPRKKLR